jgi:hypothetical protein
MAGMTVTAIRTCLECGETLTTRRGDFCRQAHRRDWNNRRAERGAQIYDLFMALRYERSDATDLKLWKLMNRMGANFREEDAADRGGRRSWRRAKDVIADRPYLKAELMVARHAVGRSGRVS